ncbi:MAG: GAF domain-containing protein [candidate division Zixibacteria bacterium]|nr:GAF domain-containing protein [candidate division Zixibacteria bacterium]
MINHSLLDELKSVSISNSSRDEYLLNTAELIQKHFPVYIWIGYYFLKGDKLHVGPYVGKPTPHTVIDLHKGICGAAVSQKATIIVDDVNADPRYLACSLETKSEIVIPLIVNGRIIGELDIDSDKKAAFSEDDKLILEAAVEIIGQALAKT